MELCLAWGTCKLSLQCSWLHDCRISQVATWLGITVLCCSMMMVLEWWRYINITNYVSLPEQLWELMPGLFKHTTWVKVNLFSSLQHLGYTSCSPFSTGHNWIIRYNLYVTKQSLIYSCNHSLFGIVNLSRSRRNYLNCNLNALWPK